MSYRTEQNVTPLEMLPELEDLERGQHGEGNYQQPAVQGGASYAKNATYPGAAMLPPAEVGRIGRFIRNGYSTPVEAGMFPYNQAPVGPPRGPVPMGHAAENYGTPIGQDQEKSFTTFNMPKDSPSCLSFAEHHANCPICSKFYNNDKTIYLIAIIVLSVVCILLLKRVLDM